jgi:hypothetical protein
MPAGAIGVDGPDCFKCGSRKAVVISNLCSIIANIYDSYEFGVGSVIGV